MGEQCATCLTLDCLDLDFHKMSQYPNPQMKMTVS